MRLLEGLTSAFIDTFGITQPTAQNRRVATRYIVTLLMLVVLLLVSVSVTMYHIMHG